MKAQAHYLKPRRAGHACRWYGLLVAFLASGTLVCAQVQEPQALDTLFMVRGEKMVGRLIGLDPSIYRMEKPLPPPPNTPPGTPWIFATVTIPRDGVDYIVFAPDLQRDEELKIATKEDLAKVAGLWEQAEPWLGVARSSAARIGLVYGDLLLRTGKVGQARKALVIFQKIEAEAWSPNDDIRAQQGRLRAMVATGRAGEAVKEAMELAKISEDPSVLIEAKFVLAAAAERQLRQLVEDNPRWTEDVFVIPERNRLYNEALDLYLYPSLFAGAESVAAARGLWGAVGIYQFTGELPAAVELSRDLITIHPETNYSGLARKYLEGLPDDVKIHDAEQQAREALKDSESPQSHEK